MDTSDLPPEARIFPRLAIAPPDTTTWGDDAALLRRLRGELVHQALALIEPGELTNQVVGRRLNQARALLGIHPEAVAPEPLAESIASTLSQPEIARFFTPGAWTLTEQEVVIPGRSPETPFRLLRPDRIVLLPEGTTWVLDFKLGLGEPDADKKQVREYQSLIADILQRPCHGALIYLDRQELVELEVVSSSSKRQGKRQGTSRFDHSDPKPSSAQTPEVAPHPIQVYPLDSDLISLLQSELGAGHDPALPLNLAKVQVIFPHRRPKLYLLQKLARALGRPFFPPRCLSLEDWILRHGLGPRSSLAALSRTGRGQ
jgi:hypothetical protein